MALNETICVLESQKSNVEILEVGEFEGRGILLGLGIAVSIGAIIIIIYFLKYKAP